MPSLAILRTVLLTLWICCGHKAETVATLRGADHGSHGQPLLTRFMSSLRVSETETVGYGVRGDVVHDICATDHICFIDLAFVLCGEGDRRAIGVFDQQSHAAGFAGQRSRGECVGEVRTGGVHRSIHAEAIVHGPSGDLLASLITGGTR